MSRAAALCVAPLLALGVAGPAVGQSGGDRPDAGFGEPWPFRVGERAEYDVTFGPVRVGRARFEVAGRDTIGGTAAYRLVHELEGGPFFYKIDDRQVSWLAEAPYRSVRFEQHLNQGGYHRNRRYEIDHGDGTYTRLDWRGDEEAYRAHRRERDIPIPAGALDEISLVFLARTLPLEVGRTFRFERYFQEEGNPVVVEVLRRERVRTRAGSFDTVVLRPIIRTDGAFGEDGEAEIYISDDDRRLIVQVTTSMSVGRVNMYLRSFETGS